MLDEGLAPLSPAPEPALRSQQYGALMRNPHQPTDGGPHDYEHASSARSGTFSEIRQYFEDFAKLLGSLC